MSFTLNRIDFLVQFVVKNWILIFLILTLLLYCYSTRNHHYWRRRGIQSPTAVPFLGNFISLFTPFPVLLSQYLRQYGQVFGLFNGQKPVLVIARPELIKRILVRDFHIFRNRPPSTATHAIFSHNVGAVQSEEWIRIRSIITPMFTGKKLKNMEQIMQSCVDSLMEWCNSKVALQSEQTFEALDPMGNYTVDILAKTAFATETSVQKKSDTIFVSKVKSIFKLSLPRLFAMLILPKWTQRWMVNRKWWPLYLSGYDFFETLSRHLIQERKKCINSVEHNDLLQLLINAEHDVEGLRKLLRNDDNLGIIYTNSGKEELEREQTELQNIIGSKYLSEEEIMAQAMIFFIAGYETSASTLSFCLYELALNPEIQEKLHFEIQNAKIHDPKLTYQTLCKLDYLDAIVSETLRKYSPAIMLIRESSEQYTIPELDLTLEMGQTVVIPAYAIHHNEDNFPDPEKFDPERFMPENRSKIAPYTYFPFGGGPRNCVGMRFALMEVKMALANVIDKFQVNPTERTKEKLKLKNQVLLLKTSPIYIAIKRRDADL